MEKFYVIFIVHSVLVFFLLQLVHYSLLFFAAHFVERIAVSGACLVIVIITFRFTRKWCLQDEIEVRNKAVLITGCDSGFGNILAQRLDKKGFKVFASCLFPSGPGAMELKMILSEHSKILGLDVTKQESVQQALTFVKENLGSYELWAVINNAGVTKGFSIELSTMQDFEDCMNVNAFGHIRVTKAFLSLLRPSKGRIINMNSVSSRFLIPYILPYSMSKQAAAGFNDCLRVELADTGIKVISVEPSAFRTAMIERDNVEKNLKKKISENEIMEKYGKRYIEKHWNFLKIYMSNVSENVNLVINTLEKAVCCQYPESVYTLCPTFRLEMCIKILLLLPSFVTDTLYRAILNMS